MDPVRFLKHCHRRVTRLFRRSERTDAFDRKKRIFKKLKAVLAAHSRIEEGILYPALEEREQLRGTIREAYNRHRHIQILIRGIDALISENVPCDAELKILQETVANWNEEEERRLFPQLREALDGDTLKELGTQFDTAIGRKTQST